MTISTDHSGIEATPPLHVGDWQVNHDGAMWRRGQFGPVEFDQWIRPPHADGFWKDSWLVSTEICADEEFEFNGGDSESLRTSLPEALNFAHHVMRDLFKAVGAALIPA